MKLGIVDVGGGLRGIYAAGVFDYCLEEGIRFDLCIGVSVGSANVCSYMAGQKKRNYMFYTEYCFRREYMSIHNFIFRKSYIDMDYIYGTLSNSAGENPLDYQALKKRPKRSPWGIPGMAWEAITVRHGGALNLSICHMYKNGL